MSEISKLYLQLVAFPATFYHHTSKLNNIEIQGNIEALYDELSINDYCYTGIGKFGDFLEHCSDLTKDPQFGANLSLGSPYSLSQFYRTLILLHYSRTLRDWLRMIKAAVPIRSNGVNTRYHMSESDGQLSFRASSKFNRSHYNQLAQYMIMELVKALSQIQHYFEKPLFEVKVPIPKLDYPEIEKVNFVTWGHNRLEIIFAKEDLDRQIQYPFSALQDLLAMILDDQVSNETSSECQKFEKQVELAIYISLGTGRCNIEVVANLLKTNSKRLQRSLKQHDLTFSEILDSIRQKSGLQMLSQTNVPIKYISKALDYSSNKSFSLACKRWTGLSPNNYREANMQEINA